MQEKVSCIKFQMIQNPDMHKTNTFRCILVKSHWYCTHCVLERDLESQAESLILLNSWPFRGVFTGLCEPNLQRFWYWSEVEYNVLLQRFWDPCGMNVWPPVTPICRGSGAGRWGCLRSVHSQYIQRTAKVMTFQRCIHNHRSRCRCRNWTGAGM